MREKVVNLIKREVNLRHIPGAVISVSFQGKMLMEEAVGYRMVYPKQRPMQLDTIFDIASLTKVTATLPAILKLIEIGEIYLNQKVASILPMFAQQGKQDITIMDLLTHTSGLPSHKKYYLNHLLTKDKIIKNIYNQELEYKTGTKVIYSDLGMITLYQVIETVTNQSFEEFVRTNFFEPLKMYETSFKPTQDSNRLAATEYDEKAGSYKLGIVHDENTESMGGISGHAGLFSTVRDLQNYAAMVEQEGTFKGIQILSPAILKLSKTNFTSFSDEFRGLGWLLNNNSVSSCGDLFSESSYGHTGFTGTSIWFDPSISLHVILLTNRVHFGRIPEHILNLRAAVHNIIRSCIDE
ncbi:MULTISPECIES: serine hydrolase domain-containing protein [Gracilibacillus]|uniref:serine hydrolase domain-containing protein n=1 Tax=Gracilibacillus TaxID=74385 RepID=UPI000826761D|nr:MULTISPECIES: serine hydrolase domain-containing protein [Gracilibacillus]